MAAVALFAWGVANHVTLNALIARLTALDASRRGAIIGLNSAVTYLAAFFGTTSFGAFATTFGYVASIGAASLLSIVAAVVAIPRSTIADDVTAHSRTLVHGRRT